MSRDTASSTDLPDLYANCKGSNRGLTMDFNLAKTILSSTFMTTDVRATGR